MALYIHITYRLLPHGEFISWCNTALGKAPKTQMSQTQYEMSRSLGLSTVQDLHSCLSQVSPRPSQCQMGTLWGSWALPMPAAAVAVCPGDPCWGCLLSYSRHVSSAASQWGLKCFPCLHWKVLWDNFWMTDIITIFNFWNSTGKVKHLKKSLHLQLPAFSLVRNDWRVCAFNYYHSPLKL